MRRHARLGRQNAQAAWNQKTEEERKQIAEKISTALTGRKTGQSWTWGMIPGPTRGRKKQPMPDEHKKKISQGVQRYHAAKRQDSDLSDLSQKKPVVGTKSHSRENNAADSKQPRSNGTGNKALSPRIRQQFVLLCERAVRAVELAYVSLEHGGTVAEARAKLRQVDHELSELEDAYRACNW